MRTMKKDIYNKSICLIFLYFLDVVINIIYSVYWNYNFYVIPLSLSGVIAAWKYYSRPIYIYQLNLAISICMKIYTIFLNQQPYLWIFIPLEFYFIYRFWYFKFELGYLSENDIYGLRNNDLYF
jgi:hypothetical protein